MVWIAVDLWGVKGEWVRVGVAAVSGWFDMAQIIGPLVQVI